MPRVVAVLPAGEYEFRGTVMGKDYLMYEVRLDALFGFITYYGDSVTACRVP